MTDVIQAPQEVATTPATPPTFVLPAGTVLRDVKFSFKKADPVTGNKRPPVNLKIPQVTTDTLQNFLTDPEKAAKNIDYLLDVMNDIVKEAARQQVADDENPVDNQEQLDLSKLDLTYIANLPAAERRGGGIPKETWEAFGVAYNTIMPGVTGKKPEHVGNAATLFLGKYAKCKTDKKVLKVLKEQLEIFFQNASADQQEEFADIYEYLQKKADNYLEANEADLLASL